MLKALTLNPQPSTLNPQN